MPSGDDAGRAGHSEVVPIEPAAESVASVASSTDPAPLKKLLQRVAILSSGTTLSHILVLAVSPLLTRMYQPEDFAVFGVYQALLAVTVVLLTLQFEQAIPLPESAGDACTLKRLALVASVAVAVLLTLLMGLFVGAKPTRLTSLSPVLLVMLPACALGEAFARTYRLEAVREARFRSMGISRVVLSLGTVTGQLTYAFCGLGGLGLWVGDAFGRWLSVLPLLWRRKEHNQFPSPQTNTFIPHDGAFRFARTRSMVAQFQRFPLLLTPAALLMLVITMSPALILPSLYGEEFAGQYAVASRAVLMPLMIISQAVTHVYASEAARMIRERSPHLPQLVLRTLLQMSGLGLILAGTAAVLGPRLCPIVFGSQWVLAGKLIPWLALSGFGHFVGGPVLQVIVLLRQELRCLTLHAIGATAVIVSLFGSAALGLTGEQATVAFAFTLLAILAMYAMQSWHVACRETRKWVVPLSPSAPVPTAAKAA